MLQITGMDDYRETKDVSLRNEHHRLQQCVSNENSLALGNKVHPFLL